MEHGHISCILTTCFNFCSGFSFYFYFSLYLFWFFVLISFLFSCLNFQCIFFYFFLISIPILNYCFNFHPDLLFLISIFIVLIPILISGLNFHSNKFDCLNFISHFLVKFLINFYFPNKNYLSKSRVKSHAHLTWKKYHLLKGLSVTNEVWTVAQNT